MGYLVVPDIKDEWQVCQGDCQHTDCAALRAFWPDAKCAICGEPMKAGQSYFNEGKGVAHAGCVYDRETKRQRAMRGEVTNA